MNTFNRRTAVRIAVVSVLLAAVTSPIAWFVAHRNAEEATVSLAIEESGRLLRRFDTATLNGPEDIAHARTAAEILVGGLFDIAEIYNRNGDLLAEAMTVEGLAVEARLPHHRRPTYVSASHQSVTLDDGRWILRVFVPLQGVGDGGGAELTGYFEGVRVVPAWQRAQMRANALNMALMAGLAALLCGAAIYPVVVRLSADNERKAREVLDSHIAMVQALGRAIAKRDSDTGAHNFRVAWIAARLAEELGLRGRDIQSLIVGSFLHDVGKISVPDAILRKQGALDAAESAIMQTHVQQGEEIVSSIGWLEDAHAVVAGHHEKWDGSGYPRGLAGEAIPLAARIFAVADVFDALCSERPYKRPMDFDSAMAILEAGSGSHFDPRVLAAFQKIARGVHARLARCDENGARSLLEERVRVHFGL
jgi:putative nucleotidyltransferase with HDIG domain